MTTTLLNRLLGIATDAGYLLIAASPALRGTYRRWALPRYRHLADRYADHVRSDPTYLMPLQFVLPALPDTPGSILEVGAGTGAALAAIAGRYPASHLAALDFSPAMLAQIEQGAGVHCVIGDTFVLPVRTGSVDLVIAHNAPFDLRELMRVTSANGTAAVILSNAGGIPAWLRWWCLRRSGASRWNYTEYHTGKGIALLFRSSTSP